MGDFDEIITTFPSPLKHKQAKGNITGQKQQQTNKHQKKTKAQGCSEGVHTEGAGTGQAGRRSRAKWPVPRLSACPLLRHQLLMAQTFPGCLTLCCSPSSEFLGASLQIPASCVWARSWRP